MIRISILLLVVVIAISSFTKVSTNNFREPNAENEESFLMPVEDIFSIAGRGTVVLGIVERGVLRKGDSVEIVGMNYIVSRAKVTGIDVVRQALTEAKKGDNVGVFLSGIDKAQIRRGMVICAPGSIKAYTEFKCTLTLKPATENGRSTPVYIKYRPQFQFRTHTVSGEVTAFEGKEELKPGESARATVKVIEPVALDAGTEFQVKEGARIVGTGKVVAIIK